MKLVVFDVDGTLIDSQALIIGAMQIAFEEAGMVPPGREDVLSIVGLSLPVAIGRLVPDCSDEQCDVLAEGYRNAFLSRRAVNEAPLYPGARDCLDALFACDDLLLAVATGKSRRGLDAMLEHHGLERYFVSLQTADNHPSKPHPEMLLTACREAGVDAGKAMMIGDTDYDMDMAKAAGTGAIGVSWGYHPVERLQQAGVPVAGGFAALQKMIGDWAR
ncbi:MAG: HAD-IA family hydrolase [Paracoccus sp. (in: a-proteobacteria)]